MKKSVFLFIMDFFSFSQKEMNGFLVITLLMISIVTSTIIYNHYSIPDLVVNEKDQKTLDSLLTIVNTNSTENSKQSANSPIKEENPETRPTLFAFDPNTASKNDFIELGLSEYLSERILKYRSKGGKFKIKTDFKKIYGLKEDQYLTLKPFIDLPESLYLSKESSSNANIRYDAKTVVISKQKQNKVIEKQDINTADSLAFEKVYGIGFTLASRIVKYRRKLGGFIDLKQLKEVYGLDSIVISEIEKKFEIEPGFQPTKINVNSEDMTLLKSHPYVGFKKANLILNYRKMHGTYHGIDQLKLIKAISEEEIERLKPYLEF